MSDSYIQNKFRIVKKPESQDEAEDEEIKPLRELAVGVVFWYYNTLFYLTRVSIPQIMQHLMLSSRWYSGEAKCRHKATCCIDKKVTKWLWTSFKTTAVLIRSSRGSAWEGNQNWPLVAKKLVQWKTLSRKARVDGGPCDLKIILQNVFERVCNTWRNRRRLLVFALWREMSGKRDCRRLAPSWRPLVESALHFHQRNEPKGFGAKI